MRYDIYEDPQAEKVFAADIFLCGDELLEMHEIEHFLLDVAASRWFRREFPQVDGIQLVQGHCWTDTSNGWPPNDWFVAMPLQRPQPRLLVVHALAHGLIPAAAHGPLFCRTHLQLVREFVGKEVAELLQRLYVKLNVRHKKPRVPAEQSRILSEGFTGICGTLDLEAAGYFRDEY